MKTVQVVIWSGKYHADGVEVLDSALKHKRIFHYTKDPELVGSAGNWSIVAEFKST